ncbi:MAG: dephospho-CoA kinase [Syntrophus sp. (in: bacteria)]|nr:dephospho-CoA kinase [Syntrophus sp. (in: bacteria)]
MIVIGITGIIGSGKTTVSGILNQNGFAVIDLDSLAKQVSDTDEVKGDIRKVFGREYIRENNSLDVEKMRDLVFNNEERLKTLEGLIHPRIIAEMERELSFQKAEGANAVIVDGPLIFETDLHKRLDKIVVVSADIDVIKERLIKRGMNKEDIGRRISHQIPLREKEKAAHYVLYNNGTEDDLKKEIMILLDRIKTWEVSDTCTLTI